MSLISVLSAISRWSDVADWRSWITHALIAPGIAATAALALWAFGAPRPLVTGCALAVVFYFLRECEQVAHELFAGVSIPAKHWLDHVMDIIAPAVTCFGLSRLF